MLYALNEMRYHTGGGLRLAARATRDFWGAPYNPVSETPFGRNITAAADLFANVTRRYGKPDWMIDHTVINDQVVRVRQNTVWSSPWVNLVHFSRESADLRKAGRRALDPAVLIVAPLSGHYATLLRGTVEAFLPDHDVYITDWRDARAVPLRDGPFDLDDYIDYLIAFLHELGPGTHMMAVCQPSVPVLAAASLMAAANDACAPASAFFEARNRLASSSTFGVLLSRSCFANTCNLRRTCASWSGWRN